MFDRKSVVQYVRDLHITGSAIITCKKRTLTSKYNKHVKLLQDCNKVLRTRSKQLKLAKHRKQEHLVLLGSE